MKSLYRRLHGLSLNLLIFIIDNRSHIINYPAEVEFLKITANCMDLQVIHISFKLRGIFPGLLEKPDYFLQSCLSRQCFTQGD